MSSDPLSVLEQRARALASRPAELPSTGAPLVFFRRGGRLLGASAQEVDGAGRVRALTPVPASPPWLAGAVQHQNAVLSLIDLVHFWGLPYVGVADLPSFVVLTRGGARIGLLAEELLGFDDTDGPPGPYEGERHAGVTALARRKGEPVYVLSAAGFFEDPRLSP